MAPSLKLRHLPRYGDLARLLVKHGRVKGVRDADEATREDAELLVADLESRGATFVKFGQLLATRSDLLPREYTDALARLQDDVAPFSFAAVQEIVSEELAVRISKAFESFEPEPLASGSLGQVHRAILRDGRPVAVKVQRPGVRDEVARDMEVIRELAAFVDDHTRIGRQFGFAAMVDEFDTAITAELDYRIEAENLGVLREALANFDAIVVPQPVPDYTSTRVLTMDYVDGRNVSSIGPLGRLEIHGEELAASVFRAYLDQILVHGFVHADPHPGNVLLTGDGRLALIDVGMVTRIGPQMQDDLLRILLALTDARGADVADVMARISERRDDFDEGAFRRRVGALVQQNQGGALVDLDAGRIIGEIARAGVECGLRPPVELTMLTKALLDLDQVAKLLAPSFDPNVVIAAHVGEVMRHKMLTSVGPGRLLSAAIDAKEFAEHLPSRVNKVMDALARGELTLKVEGIDEKELMRGIQKLANRVTTGLIIAALIVGAAMIMRAGYTGLAIGMLVVAAIAGAWLLITTVVHDLPQKRQRR